LIQAFFSTFSPSTMTLNTLALSALLGGLLSLGAQAQTVATPPPAAAAAVPAPNTTGPSGSGVNNLLIGAVAWKQTAAEYRALYYQGYALARLRVQQALAQRKASDKPLAVVSDLDDTVLLPLPYWGHLVSQNKDFFDDAIWDSWIPKNQMVVAPGAQGFFKYCADNGVEVFYISSRDQGERTFEYGLNHVKLAGLPYADEAHVTLLRESSNKEKRQDEIAQKFDVVVFLGDNLNDFRRKYYSKNVDERLRLMEEDREQYGQRYIVFPNPTDGHWMRAIFGDSEPPASDAHREIFKKAATRSSWDGR
jgi:5'-nucleotidase (lipoprotein e(P4) family)